MNPNRSYSVWVGETHYGTTDNRETAERWCHTIHTTTMMPAVIRPAERRTVVNHDADGMN